MQRKGRPFRDDPTLADVVFGDDILGRGRRIFDLIQTPLLFVAIVILAVFLAQAMHDNNQNSKEIKEIKKAINSTTEVFQLLSEKNQPNGYGGLDSNAQLFASEAPDHEIKNAITPTGSDASLISDGVGLMPELKILREGSGVNIQETNNVITLSSTGGGGGGNFSACPYANETALGWNFTQMGGATNYRRTVQVLNKGQGNPIYGQGLVLDAGVLDTEILLAPTGFNVNNSNGPPVTYNTSIVYQRIGNTVTIDGSFLLDVTEPNATKWGGVMFLNIPYSTFGFEVNEYFTGMRVVGASMIGAGFLDPNDAGTDAYTAICMVGVSGFQGFQNTDANGMYANPSVFYYTFKFSHVGAPQICPTTFHMVLVLPDNAVAEYPEECGISNLNGPYFFTPF